MSHNEAWQLAEHFFRHHYAKMVAILAHYFGLREVEIAEDIAQETLIEAMDSWSAGSIPENPEAWLMDVAKKKTINLLRRNQTFTTKVQPTLEQNLIGESAELEKTDSTLRMIFACCHPALPMESQISLALKTLCGLNVPEIANALLTSESNINKRLYRAKQKFRDGTIDLSLPNPKGLPERLSGVFTTLYLLFNEGYYSSHHEKVIRMDLCFDAIRLLEEVADFYPASMNAKALLALMFFSISRFESRIDEQGALVILTEQDRTKWDQEFIAKGVSLLHAATQSEHASIYHLQAGISAEHCLAKDFVSTNWESIYHQYTLLEQLQANLHVRFNKTIAKFYGHNREEALADLLALTQEKELQSSSQFYATLGTFYLELGLASEALPHFQQALKLSKSSKEKALILQKIANS